MPERSLTKGFLLVQPCLLRDPCQKGRSLAIIEFTFFVCTVRLNAARRLSKGQVFGNLFFFSNFAMPKMAKATVKIFLSLEKCGTAMKGKQELVVSKGFLFCGKLWK